MTRRPPSSPNELTQTLALELRILYRKLKQRIRETGGTKDLTLSQISVLARLERDGPATVSRLARAEGMRSQSMGEIVAPLQSLGFLASAPDPSDGRQTLISLTPKCVSWIQEGRTASHDWLSTTINEKLSLPEQETVHEALGLLGRLVED